jgi:hypothetical protein
MNEKSHRPVGITSYRNRPCANRDNGITGKAHLGIRQVVLGWGEVIQDMADDGDCRQRPTHCRDCSFFTFAAVSR